MLNPEKIMNTLQICKPRLSYVAALPWEIQKSRPMSLNRILASDRVKVGMSPLPVGSHMASEVM